jgi:uncharacterized protein (TIGR00369 family)
VTSPHDALHGSLAERLHFTVLEVGAEHARARLDVHEDLLQGKGIVHGGVLFTLADAVAANLAIALAPDANGATIDASIRFFRPVRKGAIDAHARLLHRGKRTLALEVELRDAERRLVALYGAAFLIQEDDRG